MHIFRTKSETFEGAAEDFLDWAEKIFTSSKQSIRDLRASFRTLTNLRQRRKGEKKRIGTESLKDSALVHIKTFKPSVKSDVWNYMYFTKLDDGTIEKDRVTCIICGQQLSFKSSSTGDLRGHLATHPLEMETHDRLETESERSGMTRWLESQKPLSRSRKAEIDSAILRFIVMGIQPFSVVENGAFKSLISLLEPRYNIPSRTTMSQSRLHDLYLGTVERLWLEQKDRILGYSLTVDGWTSGSNVHYMGITTHFIDENWNFISLPLDFIALPHSTGESVSKSVLDALERRQIDTDRLVSVTSDAGGDLKKGCELLRSPHYLCVLHGIHNAISSAVKNTGMEHVMKRLKELVNLFHSSPKLWESLKTIEKKDGIEKPKKLKRNFENRWGAEYDMVERFLEIRNSVHMTLVESRYEERILHPNEVEKLEFYLKELKLLRKIISTVQSQSTPMFSRAVCLLMRIKDKMLQRRHDGDDDDTKDEEKKRFANEFRLQLLEAFQSSQHIQEVIGHASPLTLTVVFMDPRHKHIIVTENDVHSLEVIEKTINDCVEHFHLDEIDCQKSVEEEEEEDVMLVEESATKDDGMDALDLLDDECLQSSIKKPELTEFERYQQEPPCKMSKDVLQWWKEKESEYPKLSKVARVLLSVMPTSAPCESLFSIVGKIQDERRCSLSPIVLRQLVLLHRWLSFKEGGKK